MKKILLILLISINLTSYGKLINAKELQNVNGVSYKKNKKIPYTGKIFTIEENGQLNRQFIPYYENRQTKYEKNFKE